MSTTSPVALIDNRHIRFLTKQVDLWITNNWRAAEENAITFPVIFEQVCASFNTVFIPGATAPRIGSVEEERMLRKAARAIRTDLGERFPEPSQAWTSAERLDVLIGGALDLDGVDPAEYEAYENARAKESVLRTFYGETVDADFPPIIPTRGMQHSGAA
jgi:hypothetical protein